MKSRMSAVPFGGLSVLITLAVVLSACRKDPNSGLGEELGDRDFLTEHYQDTAFDIVVYTMPDTGLIVQNAERMLLGSMQDGVFGRADYHVYSQLYYAGSNTDDLGFVPDTVNGVSVDSVVLIMPYSSLYPKKEDVTYGRPIRLNLHRLTEDLLDSGHADSLYSVSSEVAYDPAVLPGNGFTITPRPFDSVTDTVNNSTYVPALSARLDPAFGLSLMTLPADAYAQGESVFSEYYPGICLRSVAAGTESESSVVSFNFGSGEGVRIIVYHGLVDEKTPRYSVFGFGPVRFTKVERDYGTSTDRDFLAQMRGDSTAGLRHVYLAASGGAYIGCVLPNVRELFAGRRIIINRAHLVLKAASAANGSGIEVPQSLTVPGSWDAAYREDGMWNKEKKEYRLMLTRYLQHLFYEEAEPEPFYIYPSTEERYGTPRAVKLNGPSAENGSPMKLELIYTEVEE